MRVATRSRHGSVRDDDRGRPLEQQLLDARCRRCRGDWSGSSRRNSSGVSASARASAPRLRSPPDRLGTDPSPRRGRSGAGTRSGALRRASGPARRGCARDGRAGRGRAASTRAGARVPARRASVPPGLSRVLSSPSSSCASPAITRRSEDFPLPFRPIRPMRLPSRTVSAAWLRSGRSPYASGGGEGGERQRFRRPPTARLRRRAWRSAGSPPRPPNATLVFEVELLGVS